MGDSPFPNSVYSTALQKGKMWISCWWNIISDIVSRGLVTELVNSNEGKTSNFDKITIISNNRFCFMLLGADQKESWTLQEIFINEHWHLDRNSE